MHNKHARTYKASHITNHWINVTGNVIKFISANAVITLYNL